MLKYGIAFKLIFKVLYMFGDRKLTTLLFGQTNNFTTYKQFKTVKNCICEYTVYSIAAVIGNFKLLTTGIVLCAGIQSYTSVPDWFF